MQRLDEGIQATDQIIGRRIKEHRISAGLSQRQLAEKVSLLGQKMTAQVVYNLEVGERSLKLSEAQRLSEALDLPVTALLPGIHQPSKLSEAWTRAVMAGEHFSASARELADATRRLESEVASSGGRATDVHRQTLESLDPCKLLGH